MEKPPVCREIVTTGALNILHRNLYCAVLKKDEIGLDAAKNKGPGYFLLDRDSILIGS